MRVSRKDAPESSQEASHSLFVTQPQKGLPTSAELCALEGNHLGAPERLTSTQVMISRSRSSSPASGSVLTAQSLEPVLDSVVLSLYAPPPFMLCLSLSQK